MGIKETVLRGYAYFNQGESLFSIPMRMFKMFSYSSMIALAWGLHPVISFILAFGMVPVYMAAGLFSKEHMIQAQVNRIEKLEFDGYSQGIDKKLDRVLECLESR